MNYLQVLVVLALTMLCVSAVADDPITSYLSTIEQNVLDELNLARSNPNHYADYLRRLRSYYHGKELRRPGEVILITREGLPALDEAISFLSLAEPLETLSPSRGLSLSAADHVKDQAQSGNMSHLGSDDSQPWDRMNRYGSWQKTVAENIMYGGHKAREVVMQLIVDDGVPDRAHRNNIFNAEFQVVGIGCGPHRYFGLMCVMDFAAEFSEILDHQISP